MPEPVSVTIGKVTAELQPVGFTDAVTLAIAPDDPRSNNTGFVLALAAACLRTAWPENVAWPTRKRPRPLRLGVDPAEYGKAVLDALYAESGMSVSALVEELVKAREWVMVSVLSDREVSQIEDFSEGQEGTEA